VDALRQLVNKRQADKADSPRRSCSPAMWIGLVDDEGEEEAARRMM